MATLVIALKDIIVDPERTVALTALPEPEAIALIEQSYGFLSASIDVAIHEGVAVITLPETDAERAAGAHRTYGRAVRAAQRGDHACAILLFEEVLEGLPADVEARRELALSHLASGDEKQAKDRLIEALKLDPTDAWSYHLLASIYLKHERSFDRADELFRRALELKPDDAIVLASFGALCARRGHAGQATDFFDRATQADPLYLDPYYDLALICLQQGNPSGAIAHIDHLFTKAKATYSRSRPLYADARRLFLAANQAIAASTTGEMMDLVQQRRKALEEQGSVPIRICQDENMTVDATAQHAWRHARGYHLITYRNKTPSITPHLLANKLEHLALEIDERATGRSRTVATTAAHREYARRSISSDIPALRSAAMPQDRIADYVDFAIEGLVLQLHATPVDMIVEERLHDRQPLLRPSQVVSLHATLQENQRSVKDARICTTSQRLLWQANAALKCAMALFVDHLYPGCTDHVDPFRQLTIFHTGQKLFSLWQVAARNFHPGDEYDIVDECARVLGMQRWYGWVPDQTAWLQTDDEDDGESPL